MDQQLWTAIAFLMIGVFLTFGEVIVPGFFIAVPGGTLMFMGAIGIFFPEAMFGGWWSILLWPLAAIIATLANIWFYRRWAPAGRAPLTIGIDSLPGHEGIVLTEVRPNVMTGKVRIKGTVWSARSHELIPVGAHVRVIEAEGVHIIVEPITKA